MTKRPFSVTLTLALVLMLASWNALRAWTFILWQDILTETASRMPPFVGIAAGITWFIIGMVLLFGIWQKKAWSAKMLLGATAGYVVWVWGGRFIWQNPRPNIIFTVILNLVCLIPIYFTFKSLSREAYERNTENPKTE
ncbi:hypothetical protein MASR2M66_34020 [Chloroflexota bacterium]